MNQPAGTADAVAEVEALQHALMRIYSDSVEKNLDQVMEFFADGAEMRQFDVMTPREFNGREFRDHFVELAANYSGKVEVIDLRVDATAEMAFSSCIQHTWGTAPNGQPFDMSFRVTDCLKKIGGKWKIVHEHVSFPIDMKTGKADFQSKP